MVRLAFSAHRGTVRDLLREHAVVRGGVSLASGELSDVYVDVKRAAFMARATWPLAAFLCDELSVFADSIGILAGVALGGCHLASVTAAYMAMVRGSPVDVAYVRGAAKDHGTRRLVEIPSGPDGRRVVLIEDVVTTGGSAIRASDLLSEAGLEVAGVLALVDRRPVRDGLLGGRIKIRSMFSLDEIAGPL